MQADLLGKNNINIRWRDFSIFIHLSVSVLINDRIYSLLNLKFSFTMINCAHGGRRRREDCQRIRYTQDPHAGSEAFDDMLQKA